MYSILPLVLVVLSSVRIIFLWEEELLKTLKRIIRRFLWAVPHFICGRWETSSLLLNRLDTSELYTVFLTFWPFLLRIDCACVWYVWKFDAVTLPILYWCHKSLVLWPRVSISTLFTWSAVIWHSFRKSCAVYSRGFPFISSDDMKLRAFWGRSSGRPSSFLCSME